jgi:NAD(P)-dependent dehydrogenase (short-subunit alcohol dehydrogenase family)
MSLINKICWVVGGVGPIGRGITRSLLSAGATVIVNSRESSRLEKISKDLNHPDKLVLVHGSLLPGQAQTTVDQVLTENNLPLHHVVAHGAVRYWTKERGGGDETFLLDERRLLDMDMDEFLNASCQLSRLHFSAAKTLLPRLEGLSDQTGLDSSYTFVTGNGGGHVSGMKLGAGEINSYHIWGLSKALRGELQNSSVACREIRVNLPINRPTEERCNEPRERPLSEDLGDLCAGIALHCKELDGQLIDINSQNALKKNLIKFKANQVS